MLESIHGPQDLNKLNYQELDELSAEIRDFLIRQVSKSGGHLGPNLGVVELTLAEFQVIQIDLKVSMM